MNNTENKPEVPILFTDTETFSTVDIKTAGAIKYAEHAEMLLAGFKLKDQYDVWDYTESKPIPTWVFKHINSGGLVAAHNAIFDFCVLREHIPSLRIDQMVDTQAMCGAHGLPLSLEKAGDALGLEKQKLAKEGKRLVTKFCIPHNYKGKTTRKYPQDAKEDWALFRDQYLRLDIESLEELYNRLPKLTEYEQAIWVDTQKINLAGVPVDTATTQLIIDKLDKLVDDESTRFIRLTGLFPTQRDRVLQWVKDQGVKIANLQAATVQEVLVNKNTPELVVDALTARANTTHMSFKKFPTIMNTVMEDDTVKGTLMYHVASTGRFGGRLLQTQNLTRGSIDGEEAVKRIQDGEFNIELVKSSVRPMIYHPEGFTVVDYSSIEARVVQYIAKDYDALEVFRQGLDPYKWMAQKIYGVQYEDVTDKQRFTGKQAILGLGYQMSAKKFIMMVESYGETIAPKEAELVVRKYRDTHYKVVKFWETINRGSVFAIQRPDIVVKVNNYVSFEMGGDFLYMNLPSGRRLAYYQPQLESGAENFSYMSVNEKNQYVRTHTYGGKLTENLVQAFARDLLVEAVHQLILRDYRIVTHIHDEIVVLGMNNKKDIETIMCTVPEWATGLPVEVEGFTTTRFKKG